MGNIPGVELRLSDKRLFQLINHIQTIPFPESKHPTIETNLQTDVDILHFPLQTFLSTSNEIVEETTSKRQSLKFEDQLTQLEATFRLDKVKT